MGKFIDLSGKKFGRLLVIKRVGTKNGQAVWECVCDCGKSINTVMILLRQGRTKSCGCLRTEVNRVRMTAIANGRAKNLLGKRFGRLLVLESSEVRTGKHRMWFCRCDCGVEKLVQARFLLDGCAVSCGCFQKEQQIKMRRASSRGITSMLLRARSQKVSFQWRIAVFERDSYTCQDCGIKSGSGKTVILNADHIKPLSVIMLENKIETIEEVLACEEIWDINNGRTLCFPCHKNTPTFGGRMHGILFNKFFAMA